MKELWIYIYDTCVISEITLIPWFLKSEEDLSIQLVAAEQRKITSYEGYSIFPDKKLSELTLTDEIVGMLFPGGEKIILLPRLKELIQQLDTNKQLLGGICAGPEFFARAGILYKYRYTTSNTAGYFQKRGEFDPFPHETYVESRSVRDGHVITAKGEAFLDFTDLIFQFIHLYASEGERKSFMSSFIPTME